MFAMALFTLELGAACFVVSWPGWSSPILAGMFRRPATAPVKVHVSIPHLPHVEIYSFATHPTLPIVKLPVQTTSGPTLKILWTTILDNLRYTMPREARLTAHVDGTARAEAERQYLFGDLVFAFLTIATWRGRGSANDEYSIASKADTNESFAAILGDVPMYTKRVAWRVQIHDCSFGLGTWEQVFKQVLDVAWKAGRG